MWCRWDKECKRLKRKYYLITSKDIHIDSFVYSWCDSVLVRVLLDSSHLCAFLQSKICRLNGVLSFFVHGMTLKTTEAIKCCLSLGMCIFVGISIVWLLHSPNAKKNFCFMDSIECQPTYECVRMCLSFDDMKICV